MKNLFISITLSTVLFKKTQDIVLTVVIFILALSTFYIIDSMFDKKIKPEIKILHILALFFIAIIFFMFYLTRIPFNGMELNSAELFVFW